MTVAVHKTGSIRSKQREGMQYHLEKKIFFALVGCFWSLFIFPTPAYAQAVRVLQKSFIQAQESLSIGNMKLFVKALGTMEASFLAAKSKLSEAEREQYQLWLYRFQFKRYQISAKVPPIRDFRTFESAQALGVYAHRFTLAIQDLQKALLYLRRYNQLYNRLALTQGVQAQITLQASLSLERDLDTLVRQSQIYTALLKFAQDNWSQQSTFQKKLTQRQKEFLAIKEYQKRASIERGAIKAEQQRLANRVKDAQMLFVKEQKHIAQRKQNVRVMWITGGILAVIGIGLASAGGIFLHDNGSKDPYADYNCAAKQEPAAKRLCEEQKAFPNPIIAPPQDQQGKVAWKGFLGWGGPAFLAGGIVFFGAGVALVVSGLVLSPSPRASFKAVLRSQERFLKKNAPSPHETSQLPPPHGIQKSQVLGIFH